MAVKKSKTVKVSAEEKPGFHRVIGYAIQWNLDFEVGEIVLELEGIKHRVGAAFASDDGQTDEFLTAITVLRGGFAEATADGGVIRSTRWIPMADAAKDEIAALQEKPQPWPDGY